MAFKSRSRPAIDAPRRLVLERRPSGHNAIRFGWLTTYPLSMFPVSLIFGLLAGFAAAAGSSAAEPSNAGPVLVPGNSYTWVHHKRKGLEAWQHYVFCKDLKSARAFTVDVIEYLEARRAEKKHTMGSHVDYVFPKQLGCEQVDRIEFRPAIEQMSEELSTLGWSMVYLNSEDASRATHQCGERPCAFAPVMRKFVRVVRTESGTDITGWLRVEPAVTVGAPSQ